MTDIPSMVTRYRFNDRGWPVPDENGRYVEYAAIEHLLQPETPADWRVKAAAWLREKAVEQEKTNAECPAHAAAYKSWRDRPFALRMLADEVLLRPASETSGEPSLALAACRLWLDDGVECECGKVGICARCTAQAALRGAP